MSPKPKILHQWQRPKEVAIYLSNVIMKLSVGRITRVLLVVAIIEIILYIFFTTVTPNDIDIDWEKMFIIVFIYAAVSTVILFIVMPLSLRYSKAIYKITEDGIHSGTSSWKLKWSQIEGYSVSKEKIFPDLIFVSLKNRGKLRSIVLPEGQQADDILETISQRLPEIEPEKHLVINLTKLQHIYLTTLTFLYSFMCVYVLMRYGNRYVVLAIMCITLYFGPGTIGLIHLHEKFWKKDKRLKGFAITYNFIAFILTALLGFLIMYYRICKQIEGG